MLYIGAILDQSSRHFVLAFKSLWLHKLRSLLSIVGIIIGTAAVIALMSFGEGAMQDALEAIKRQGATNIVIRSVKPPDEGSADRRSFVATYGLTYDDYDRFRKLASVIRHVPLRSFKQEIRHLHRLFKGDVVGTTAEYAAVHKFKIVEGRFLAQEDDDKVLNVCVLGADLASTLFPFESPLGRSVDVGKFSYVVIGVVEDRMPTGGSGGSESAQEFNDDLYVPLNTCNARFGDVVAFRQTGSRSAEKVILHQITLTVSDMDKVRPTGDIIRKLLTRYHGNKGDWVVTVPLDKLQEAEEAKDRFSLLMWIVGSISLLVGGIGIMNIMLATVTERTREIGIRRALGAKRRDITWQFLVEAVVQTGIGGLLGVAVGIGLVFALPPLLLELLGKNIPPTINVLSIFLSFGFAVAVGILFGLYPAIRAARLDPIEALRAV